MRILPTLSIALVLLLLTVPLDSASNGSGGLPGRTGAPGDGDGSAGNSGTCNDAGCHNSFELNSGTGTLTIAAPPSFDPGQPLSIAVTVEQDGASRFGFQLTIKDSLFNHVGSFELSGEETRFAGNNPAYVTHSLATARNSWSVTWHPPAADPGTVTLYASGNAADGRFTALNDHVYTTSLPIVRGTSTATEIARPVYPVRFRSLYPNPARHDVHIKLRADLPSQVFLELVNLNGRRVLARDVGMVQPGEVPVTISVAGLASGMYLIVLRSDLGSTLQSPAAIMVAH